MATAFEGEPGELIEENTIVLRSNKPRNLPLPLGLGKQLASVSDASGRKQTNTMKPF